MADETTNDKGSFPSVPARQWWTLRDKFKQSIPKVVTPSYLATILNMQEKSADANILRSLKAIGLVDKDGKHTDRAVRWRDDESYPAVCEEIRREIYPAELLEAIHDHNGQRSAVERWFANRTKQGAAAVGKMSSFFVLLSEADPTKSDQRRQGATAPKAGAGSVKRTPVDPKSPGRVAAKATPRTILHSQLGPVLHIDVQIHISADATATQIDQIFASMAKHLYRHTVNDEQAS